MKSRLAVLLAFLAALPAAAQQPRPAPQFQPALPGYRYQFPRDHFDHPGYQTEWWYYTGNLKSADGHRFGFELTFFRQGVSRAPNPSPWYVHDLYMAHLALSDIHGRRFYHAERLSRSGPGIAGVSQSAAAIWNGNWQVQISGSKQQLRGATEDFGIDLTLDSAKPPVLQGQNGVSQKAAGPGHASHYISLTRLLTSGTLTLHGVPYRVTGASWMDHEFFTDGMGSSEIGWDWLSIQLDDNTELMLYRLRHRDGSIDPYSSGSFVAADGRSQFLSSRDFTMTPAGAPWTSPKTGAAYPVRWHVAVPRLGLELEITTPLVNQELDERIGPSYWEGVIDVAGRRAGAPIHGDGYLEMTGYAPFQPQPAPPPR